MSLPDGFLDELRTRVSLSQVVGRKVIWDNRKSNQAKGDMWAPCPFHQEKTASFHVDDRKGFYYCFGCHAKGNAITFLREIENISFMEAVERLAAEAGMQMPARDPRAQERSDRNAKLAEVMEAAVRYYRLQLRSSAGATARQYLNGRQLDDTWQGQFEIGFAPNARQGLFQHLTDQGIPVDDLIDAGLCARPDDGGAPYDRFRDRIMFPIRDARGRAIAFGGRAMDPNARAKYLNSPETALFDKGRSLYNHAPAREAAGKGAPLIVAEGYMDVIALVKAGFGAAVAPLGTAVTETQLQLMWRIAPEPIIALDGDTAGLRAAMRVIDLALPLLEAGRSLRFAIMPEGMDPDDVIKTGGPAAMQKLIDGAQPMVQLLWQRETQGGQFDSPERKAALDKALRERIRTIRDPSIRQHYGAEISRLRQALFTPPAPQRGKGRFPNRYFTPRSASSAAKSSALAGGGADPVHLREAVILAALIKTPALVSQFETALDRLDCTHPDHAQLRDFLLTHQGLDSDDLINDINAAFGPDLLDKLMRQPLVAIAPCLRRPNDLDLVQATIEDAIEKITAERGLSAEMQEAATTPEDAWDETQLWRLTEAAKAQERAMRATHEDRAEYDIGPNGLPLKRDERSAFQNLVDQITNRPKSGG